MEPKDMKNVDNNQSFLRTSRCDCVQWLMKFSKLIIIG